MPKTFYSYILLQGTTEHPLKLRIDAWVACGNGKKFEGIAIVHKPLSGNPSFSFPQPYGANGIMQILRSIQQGINTSDIVVPEQQ